MPKAFMDELIHLVERRQAAGEKVVYLDEATREAFLKPVQSGEGKRSSGHEKPQRPSVTPPRDSAPGRDLRPARDTRQQPASAEPSRIPGRQSVSMPPARPDVPDTAAKPQSVAHAAAETDRSFSATAPVDERSLNGLGMDELRTLVTHCRACPLHEQRTQTVFGDGDPEARLMFIGEGPGYDEDVQGIPFVGKAGQLLTRMIEAMQFRRDEVYIANIVKCRPPNNRNPEEAEAARCLPFLRRQIELVAPEVIVLLGAVPLKYLLNETGINRCRGNWFEYRGIPVMPTFHPAYLLRVEAKKRDAWEDLQKVMLRLGKDPKATVRSRQR